MQKVLNKLRRNTCQIDVDSRSTRSHDAILKLGIISIFFKDGKMKLDVNEHDRAANKQAVVDIERILHANHDMKVNKDTLHFLGLELHPIASKILTVG